MASAFGPTPAADASIMMSSHSTDHLTTTDDFDSMFAPQDVAQPPPNPPFVFPARMDSLSSAPPSFSRASGRRPMSNIETSDRSPELQPSGSEKTRRPVALPNFSFNPGAALPPDANASTLLSPPDSPYSPNSPVSPARPVGHGHRRGGSEFVGGRIREGNSIAVMSTSPTRSESGFASPSFQPPKRGHRRGMSSAISINDIPNLSPPLDYSFMKGSSAPTSPTNFERTMEILSIQPEPSELPEPVMALESKTEPESGSATPTPTSESGPTVQPRPSRARVGFSDTLEFIPRPVSMVSSDTSSVATARPSHSVSGSISSIVSVASPSGRGSPAPLSRSPTKDDGSRPSTAGAILERTQELSGPAKLDTSPRRRNSIPALLDLAEAGSVTPATPSPSKSFKRWSFFGLDAFSGSTSPVKLRPASSSSSDSMPRAVSTGSTSEHGSESATEIADEKSAKAKSTVKKDKKKKKSKAWPGSILPRKSKGQSKRPEAIAVRPPTPPAPLLSPEDDKNKADASEPHSPEVTTPTVTITESAAPPRTSEAPKRSAEDSSYQMIDLDAALGPFNTPLPHNPEWEAAQRAAGNAGKRRLHSAQGMKGFSGPGMHYHRRAESAPDLPPFDSGRSSLHRFGSSSTMADVFEEEEDDDAHSTTKSDMSSSHQSESHGQPDGDITPPAVPQRDLFAGSQETTPIVRRKGSGLSDKDQSSAHSIRAEHSRTSLHDNVIIEEPSAALFQKPSPFHNSTDSSDSATPALKQELAPVEINTCNSSNIPISPYSMSHASSYPSPRSPASVDAQRISTAPSSVADETNFQSLLMGEPGPEVRISVDYDIPSLTSSNSTMTRDSAYLPQLRMPRPTMREQRPVSVSSAFGRRRSSLASLSRLISSSHGERSKLSVEVTMDDEAEKKKKSSRAKRLSKMMQFWKPSNKQGSPS